MPHEKPIIPMKVYGDRIPEPKVRRLPTVDEQLQTAKQKVAQLKYDLDLALDKIRRLREVVQWEVEFWREGLKNGTWEEGPTALRRRLSRLAGALEYHGIQGGAGWVEKES